MDNKELTLIDIIKLIAKNKTIFLIMFCSISIVSIIYVLNIDKTYKSTLIAKLPLQNGIETEYMLDYLSNLNAKNLNLLLGFDEKKSIIELNVINKKYQESAIFCSIEFITNAPDLDSNTKNKFIAYLNNLEFFNTLTKFEKEKQLDIIKTSDKEYTNSLKNNTLNIGVDKSRFVLSSTDLKVIKHNAELNLSESKPIFELTYNIEKNKFKPSYSMLIILSLVFAFFVALTTIILKVIFRDISKNLKTKND